MDVVVRNNRTGKCYEKTIKITELWYNAPSQELLDSYEEVKKKHFNAAMAASRARLRHMEMKERNKMGKESGAYESGQLPQNPVPLNVPEVQERSASTISAIINEGH
jgi:hypothetical protein